MHECLATANDQRSPSPIRKQDFQPPGQNDPEALPDDHYHPSCVAIRDWENEGGLLQSVGL